ncbi:hypothetical protein [Micromonospora humi]|uniref:Uncharacterized protein n=1 Tax=Micromonospora humi TaxID=745366 RepID=A0A1C5HSD2_9ACTN|nr:hypothetical protein [Micromonospora humi]SCG48521.1 hypothetical protein GA0070213_103469 [Micromonospora humi]
MFDARRRIFAFLSWCSGAAFALAISVLANYLSANEEARDPDQLVTTAVLLAASTALATGAFVARPNPARRGIILFVGLPDWGLRWPNKAMDYSSRRLVLNRFISRTLSGPGDLRNDQTTSLVGTLLSREQEDIDEASKPHLPQTILISMPTPLAFILGARLRAISNSVVLQERINYHPFRRSPFFESVDLRRRPTGKVGRGTEKQLKAQRLLSRPGHAKNVAVIVTVSQDSIKGPAIEHAAANGCDEIFVVDCSSTDRVLKETTRNYRSIFEWLYRELFHYVDELIDRATAAGQRLPKFSLYIKTPVSIAFALGVEFRQRVEFDCYYIYRGRAYLTSGPEHHTEDPQ